MKHLYFGIGILLLLLLGSILVALFIHRSAGACIRQLEEAVEFLNLDDFPAAKEAGKGAADRWERRAPLLSAFLTHDELEEINNGFSDLRSYAQTQIRAEFRCCCDKLLVYLKHLSQSEIPKYYNFLSIRIGTCLLYPFVV